MNSSLHKAIAALFQNSTQLWRDDSHVIVAEVGSLFQKYASALMARGSEKTSRLKGLPMAGAAYRCAALIKLHSTLCALADEPSQQRSEDATRLLQQIVLPKLPPAKQTTLDIYGLKLTPEEEDALKEVQREIASTIPPGNARYTQRPPLVGSLVYAPLSVGRPRRASSLGLDAPFVETSERELMDKYLALQGSW